jgi:hypothetical protein
LKWKARTLIKGFNRLLITPGLKKQNELLNTFLVCDVFRLYDTEEQTTVQFTLDELVLNVQSLVPYGYQRKQQRTRSSEYQKPLLMGKLHDRIEKLVI